MINTTIVLPGPVLQRYVRAYELRQLDTGSMEIRKPLHAFHETFITFFINCRNPDFEAYLDESPAYISDHYSEPLAGVMGIQTYMRGSFVFKGRYKILNIHFQPAGFYELFRMNTGLFTDNLYNAHRCIGCGIERLHELIQRCKSDSDILIIVERYLSDILNESNDKTRKDWRELKALVEASTKNVGIEQLASMTNMTVKSFERKFITYVGVGPKLFAQIYRFNRVLEFKRSHPEATWSHISNKFDFYDPMHLAKEFKNFAGQSPKSFFSSSPPPGENFRYTKIDAT